MKVKRHSRVYTTMADELRARACEVSLLASFEKKHCRRNSYAQLPAVFLKRKLVYHRHHNKRKTDQTNSRSQKVQLVRRKKRRKTECKEEKKEKILRKGYSGNSGKRENERAQYS